MCAYACACPPPLPPPCSLGLTRATGVVGPPTKLKTSSTIANAASNGLVLRPPKPAADDDKPAADGETRVPPVAVKAVLALAWLWLLHGLAYEWAAATAKKPGGGEGAATADDGDRASRSAEWGPWKSAALMAAG